MKLLSFVFCFVLSISFSLCLQAEEISEAQIKKALTTLTQTTPANIQKVRKELLFDKAMSLQVLKKNKHTYTIVLGKFKTWNRKIRDSYIKHIYGSKIFNDVVAGMEKIQTQALKYNKINKPLLSSAKKSLKASELVLKALKQNAEKTSGIIKSFKPLAVKDNEFCYSLNNLFKSATAGDKKATEKWAIETYGACFRLHDTLLWIDIITEWEADLVTVFKGFKPCFKFTNDYLAKNDRGLSWKNFMFGRCPGANTIMTLINHDALMTEYLLTDFFVISKLEKEILEKETPNQQIAPVIISCRDVFGKIEKSLPKKTQLVFSKIPCIPFESSALNSNLWRYKEEKQVDNLINSLKRYSSNYKVSTINGLMEVLSIAQGAWNSSASAEDRYRPEIIDAAKVVKGTPEEAILTAHQQGRKYYVNGYRGSILNLHDAIKAKQYDCIRGSQLIAAIFANSGYCGVNPVRWGLGNIQAKAIGLRGHTFTTLETNGSDRCFDSLRGPGLKTSFEKTKTPTQKNNGKVYPSTLFFEKGCRSLMGFTASEIRFPQGPFKTISFRIPYYKQKKKGFPEEKPLKKPEIKKPEITDEPW